MKEVLFSQEMEILDQNACYALSGLIFMYIGVMRNHSSFLFVPN